MKEGQEMNESEPYANRDPRLAYTVLYHGGKTAYGKQVDVLPNGLNGLPQEGATKTGYYLSKFVNISVSLTANSHYSQLSIPCLCSDMLRYADLCGSYE